MKADIYLDDLAIPKKKKMQAVRRTVRLDE